MYNKKNNEELDPFIREVCNLNGTNTITDYKLDGSLYEEEITSSIVAEDTDLTQRDMCHRDSEGISENIIRWYVSVRSTNEIIFTYDTDITGVRLDKEGKVSLGSCDSGLCETKLMYHVLPSEITDPRYELILVETCKREDKYFVRYYTMGGIPTFELDPRKLVAPENVHFVTVTICASLGSDRKNLLRHLVYWNRDLIGYFDTNAHGQVQPNNTVGGRVTLGPCGETDYCHTQPMYLLKDKNLKIVLRKVCTEFEQEQIVTVQDLDGKTIYHKDGNMNFDLDPIDGILLLPDDVDVEQQLMCDGTVTFFRWYVSIKSHPELNYSYDTGLDGVTSYTLAGVPRVGSCEGADDCETLVYSAIDDRAITNYRVKFCPGHDPVYFDSDNNEVQFSEITGTVVPAGDLDVEQQVMCDGTTSFVRWYVYVKSSPGLNFSYDTGLDGTSAYTPAGEPKVGGCDSGDDCETIVVSAIDGQTIRPYLARYCKGEEVVYYDPETNGIVTPAGTVVPAGDLDVEQQVMCDGTTSFVRWYVYVKSDPSLNFSYDTDLDGAKYTAGAEVKVGGCVVEDCETLVYSAIEGKTITNYRVKFCPGQDPVYYGVDNNEVEPSTITGTLVPIEDVDVEQQTMCDIEESTETSTTFIRWHVYVKSDPKLNFSYDTDVDGNEHTLRGTAEFGNCAVDDCETRSLYKWEGDEITPIFQKRCRGKEPVYYDINGAKTDTPPATAMLLLPEDLDVSQQLMCDGDPAGPSTFIRWYVTVRGRPSGIYYDGDLNGEPLVSTPDAERVNIGECPTCPTESTELICDILPSDEYEFAWPDDKDIEAGVQSGKQPMPALDWIVTGIGGVYQKQFFFSKPFEMTFSQPVTVEYTLLPYSLTTASTVTGVKGKFIGNTGSASFDSGIVAFSGDGKTQSATFREDQVSKISLTPTLTTYLASLKFIIEKAPVRLDKKVTVTCDGRVTEKLYTPDGAEYTQVGTLGACKS